MKSKRSVFLFGRYWLHAAVEVVCGSVGDSTWAAWPEGSSRLAVQVACVDACGRFARSPLQASLLSLWTARDAVGAREVGDTEVKENREVRSLVTNEGQQGRTFSSRVHRPSIRMDGWAC